MSKGRRPYVLFYATRTALVWGTSERDAYDEFVQKMFPNHGPGHGRLVPPAREECRVRLLRPDDRGWIEDATSDPTWLDVLDQVQA